MFSNYTANQHFLSQVEQSLNAFNPHASRNNKRIYSFKISDRERNLYELESGNGTSIARNLSYRDLFSFDVPGGSRVRKNFETVFQQYERDIERQTNSLLNKLRVGDRDTQTELKGLFVAKLLNFVRNPFSIEKMLNTFGQLASYRPTDPELMSVYDLIIAGKRPQEPHLCDDLGINDLQYEKWLRVLFLLLAPVEHGSSNFFEQIVKGLIEDANKVVMATVCDYDMSCCLLSDRGFSHGMEDVSHLSFAFNLCANAFVHYTFFDPATLFKQNARSEFAEQQLSIWRRRSMKYVYVNYHRNHLDLLAAYNNNVIYQCDRRFFCASKEFYLG